MSNQNERAIIDAFQMMWGNYHEPVRLIHRSFTIVAGNAAWNALGGEVGVKCNARNPEMHRGCQAMAALRDRETKIQTQMREECGVLWINYWVPVEGAEDYYVHFINGMNEYRARMAELAAQQ